MSDSILFKVLRGTSDTNVRFSEIRGLLQRYGFDESIKGSHHIFTHSGVGEILNLQSRGSMAKAYQVKQVRNVLVRYKLGDGQQ